MSLEDSKVKVEYVGLMSSVKSGSIKTKSSVDHNFQLASYTPPEIRISASNYYLEVGSSTQNQISVELSKNDAGSAVEISLLKDDLPFGLEDSLTGVQIQDIPNQFEFENSNNPNLRYDAVFYDSSQVQLGSVKYTANSEYLAGSPKHNSSRGLDTRGFGLRDYNLPQGADSNFSSDDLFVAGVYPYYYGVSDVPVTGQSIQDLLNTNDPSINATLSDNSGDITIQYDSNDEYLWFAQAGVYDQKSIWKDSNSSGDIEDGGFIENTGVYQLSSVNWSGVDYTLYQTPSKTTSYEVTYQAST